MLAVPLQQAPNLGARFVAGLGRRRQITHFGDVAFLRNALAGAVQPGRVAPAQPAPATGRSLAVLLLGYPLWWALGVAALLPLLVAAVLVRDLVRRRGPLHLPAGAVPWLLFLCCVVAGVFLLASDAPGAVAGGFGSGRLMVFGYRLGWYLTCTVVAVWLVNSSRERLPDRRVHGWIAALCLITVCGGLVGMMWPALEFTAPIEWVLPGALRSNGFVTTLVHPEVADVQSVLGTAEARPKAPFAFTNTWGSVLALSLVYAVAWALIGARRLWARVAVTMLVLAALVPAVHSLNRGLWACLLLTAVGGTLLAVLRGHGRAVLVGGLAAGLVGAVLLGPLLSVVGQRFENQHSNDRRGSLASATVDSVTTGSPVLGFGSTRDVQGSFSSIAGGSTPDCPACGVPRWAPRDTCGWCSSPRAGSAWHSSSAPWPAPSPAAGAAAPPTRPWPPSCWPRSSCSSSSMTPSGSPDAGGDRSRPGCP